MNYSVTLYIEGGLIPSLRLGHLDLLPIISAMKRCRDLLFFYPFFALAALLLEINGKIAQKMIHAITTRVAKKTARFLVCSFSNFVRNSMVALLKGVQIIS